MVALNYVPVLRFLDELFASKLSLTPNKEKVEKL